VEGKGCLTKKEGTLRVRERSCNLDGEVRGPQDLEGINPTPINGAHIDSGPPRREMRREVEKQLKWKEGGPPGGQIFHYEKKQSQKCDRRYNKKRVRKSIPLTKQRPRRAVDNTEVSNMERRTGKTRKRKKTRHGILLWGRLACTVSSAQRGNLTRSSQTGKPGEQRRKKTISVFSNLRLSKELLLVLLG